jgi:large subunit ribosomal protein L4
MQVAVRNQSGESLDIIELNDAVFDVPMNPTLVHQAMVIYQGNRRQGTHDTKTRSEVSGGGRKPWIQKHTGRARQGSTRSPQWRHGGVVFGPHPRSYRKALPRRMRRYALRCVLSDKARSDRLVCLDSMDTVDGKTKSMAGLLERLNISSSALVVTLGTDHNVVRAAGNLKKIYTLPVNQLNAEALLSRDMLILTVEAAKWAEETLAVEPHGRRGRKFATLLDAEDGSVASVPEDDTEEETVTSESVSTESVTSETASESDTNSNGNEDGE